MTAASSPPDSRVPLSAPVITARKGGKPPLVMVTAYDFPSASVADAAGVDMILVGDTLAMVVLGHEDTLHVTIDDMAHHVGAAARAKPRALLIGDLPWLSYHVSDEETVHNAAKLVRAGAVWVICVRGDGIGHLDRIDLATDKVTGRYDIEWFSTAVITASGAVYVRGTYGGDISRINASTGRVEWTQPGPGFIGRQGIDELGAGLRPRLRLELVGGRLDAQLLAAPVGQVEEGRAIRLGRGPPIGGLGPVGRLVDGQRSAVEPFGVTIANAFLQEKAQLVH